MSMTLVRRAFAALLLLVCFGRSAALAQTALAGAVVDPQGAAIVGATVALDPNGAASRTATSDAEGRFHFDGVTEGAHTLTAEAPGFASSTLPVDARQARVVITLQVAGVAQDVTVRGTIIGLATTGKTTAPLRELPLTIDDVPHELIDAQGANDLVSALKNVPGVNSFTTYGVYEYYAFRGFLDSVQLVDGVRNEGNRVNTQLTNIERVEVLKGPSSALYGGGALGATVNLIRKKPSAARAYDFVGAFGSFDTARTAVGASGRLGQHENTLYRFDFGAQRREGYRHDDSRNLTVTPSLAWNLRNAGQVNVYYTFNHDRFGGDAGLPLVDTDLGVATKNNIPDVPRDRNYRTPQDNATSNDHNVQLVYARQLTDSVGFRDTLGYRHFDDEYFLSEEVDFIAPRTIDRYYLYFKHHRRPLLNTAEVTAHVRRGVEQDLLFGWEAERYHNFTTLPEEDFFSAASIDAFDPVETQGPSDLTPASANVFTNVTHGVYVNDHLTLGPKLKALIGGRYDIYRRTSHSDAIEDGQQQEGPIAKRSAEAFTGRAGLVYQASPAVDLYASVANAFIPQTIAQPDGTSVDPVTGNQVEFGQRFHLWNGRADLNTSIYRLAKQHVPFRRAGNIYVVAGEVRSAGFEAELESTLASNITVNASYAFTDANFLDYEPTAGTNLRGNTPVFAPRHTFNVWTGYDWANGFGANVGVRYVGQVFADDGNEFRVDGYGTLALAMRYRRGPMEVALNLNNVTGTDYLVPHQDYLQVYPGEPFNALATLRLRFR